MQRHPRFFLFFVSRERFEAHMSADSRYSCKRSTPTSVAVAVSAARLGSGSHFALCSHATTGDTVQQPLEAHHRAGDGHPQAIVRGLGHVPSSRASTYLCGQAQHSQLVRTLIICVHAVYWPCTPTSTPTAIRHSKCVAEHACTAHNLRPHGLQIVHHHLG